jgi:hypothetical protein
MCQLERVTNLNGPEWINDTTSGLPQPCIQRYFQLQAGQAIILDEESYEMKIYLIESYMDMDTEQQSSFFS